MMTGKEVEGISQAKEPDWVAVYGIGAFYILILSCGFYLV